MDSLTHVVLGATVGELLMGRQIGKKAMFYGALAGSAPDIDASVNFFVSDLDSVILHRGITHSLFTALIFGPLLGWMFFNIYKRRLGKLSSWILLFTVNIVIHDLIDTATIYGTALLLPFSNHRFSTENIFVADPVFTIPLLITVVALLILKVKSRLRKTWAITGLTLSTMYMAITLFNHYLAVNALKNSMGLRGKTEYEFFAAPTLFNSVLWNVVAKDSSGFLAGYYSIFDDSSTLELLFIPRNDSKFDLLGKEEAVRKLTFFSRGFYCLTEDQGHIYFNDMRFGQVNGWADPDSKYAFAFDLTPGADNALVVQSGRLAGSRSEILGSMWERMKGLKHPSQKFE